ncbi:MAG TPA: ABC-2 transporter permease [Bacillota bacterium]|nr:ABC-2 transporter permease [Bacillota bacterium]
MTSLIKRDFYVSRWMLVILLLNIPFSYYVSVSPLFITFWIFIMFYVSLFYTDEHNQANQTFVSFPIKREKIVFARYIFIAVILLVTLLAIFIFDHVMHQVLIVKFANLFPWFNLEPLPFQVFTLSAMGFIVIVMISLPIFFYARTIAQAIILHFALFFIGIVSGIMFSVISAIADISFEPIKRVLNEQPVLISIIGLLAIINLSYFLSVRFFTQKDLA